MWYRMGLVTVWNFVIVFADMLSVPSLNAQGTSSQLTLSDTPEQRVINQEICARTTQVRTAILDQIDGVSDCGLVTLADLSTIRVLSLNNSEIIALQAGDFSGLSSLEILRLKDNSLSALPANVFAGLTSLNRLDLRGNPGSDFTLTLQLDRTDDADDASQGPATIVVKVAEGAPFDMTVGLSVTGGTLSPSSTVTIAKGSTQSSPITVMQTGMDQATVSLGVAPALPANYRGIQTAVGDPLILFEGALQTSGFSLSIDLDGSEGDQAVQSFVVPPSGNQIIFIQIFGTDIQHAFGFSARFEYDVTQVVYEGFDAGDVLPNPAVIPEEGTGFVEINMASWSGGSATVNSGLMGTLRFRTIDTFGGTKIQLVHAELGRNDQFESLRSDGNFELEISKPYSPDIDGNGVVDIGDFLLFLEHFGTSRGNEAYLDRFDLNGNGTIDFSDFSILTNNFGKAVPIAVGTLVPVTLGNDPATVDVSDNFSDANSDVLHYTAVSSANAIATARVAGSEVTISPVDAGSAKITVIATNAGGLSATQDIAVTVQLAMVFAASRINRAVDENTLPGEKIGDPVSVMSFASRTYRLSGVDADLFVIDTSSGQIRTREGVTYDYEDKRSYWVRVVMMDQQYRDLDSIGVTIAINDVNEPPSSPPSNFLVVPGDRSLSVHYSACFDEPGKPSIMGYHAEIRTGTDGDWGNRKTIYGRNNTTVYYTKLANVSRYRDSQLINGQLYQVRVRAYNAEGAGEWSAPISGTPKHRVIPARTELELFYGTEDIVQAEIDLSNITGSGGRIIVSGAALPVNISSDKVEWIFVEGNSVNISNVSYVPAWMGFTILDSEAIWDIELKAIVNKQRIDIGDELVEPVEICLPVLAGISRPVIFSYGDEWKILENQRVDGNEICAFTDGFSRFGVGEEAEAIEGLIFELDRIDNTDDTASGPATIVVKVIPGMPFDMIVGLSVSSDGTLSASSVTIAKGSIQSVPITVAQTGIGQATVSLRAAPALPANYRGIPTDVGNPLVLFEVPIGICSRTSQVQAAILDEIGGVSDCDLVTSTQLSLVTTLSLNNSGITSLQADDFSNLSGLEVLRLKDNSLSALPANMFSNLTSLRRLDLRGNPGSDFTLTLELDRIDNTDDTASGPATIVVEVAEGAPFDMTVGLSATGGTLSPSSTVKIAKGSTQSRPITVTQTGMGPATVSLGAVPAVPEGYGAIQTAVGNPLVLFEVGPSGLNFGVQTIADQTYKQNSAISDLVLPTATGGTAPITYVLSPETNGTPNLPAGLSFNANTQTISGTPSAVFPTTTFTWTATDAANTTAELMFDITVPARICDRTSQVQAAILDQIDGVSDCGLVTVADLSSVTVLSLNNSGITALQSDDFSGLSSLETLRLKDNSLSALPADVFSGLTSLRRLDLRGNPGSDFTLTLALDRTDDADDTASGPATVVVKVSEGAPFDMTVGLSVTGGTLSSSTVTIAKGSTQSRPITVTQARIGQATVSLDAAPAVPEGYGAIQTAVGNSLVLFTSSVLHFGIATIADQIYKQNAQITDLVLPKATGGTAPITYALSPETNGTPDLPAGLGFNANTRTISGIPLAAFLTTTFTWTATDAANATAERMFDITVPAGICSRTSQVQAAILDGIDGVSDCGLVTVADLSSVAVLSLNNSGITALQSDDFSGLSSLTNLRLKDNSLSALPADVFSGLTSLNRLDLRGNPGSAFTLTLQLDRTDDADDAAQGPATIVVKVAEGAPFDMTIGLSATGGTLSSSSVTIAKGSTQSGSVTATQTGMGQATVSLDAAPALPANYRGIATAVGNSLVLFPVVNRAPEKVGTIAAQSLTEGAAAVTVDVSGNFSDPENDPLTYSATSDDEDVVTVSVQGSMVTISPVGVGSTTVTVTALDATGSNMSVDQTIAVTVNPAGLSFGSATIADQIYKQNAQITDLVLPKATGGTAPITYALSPETNGTPDLPAGLGFNANTRTISGTPSAAFSTTEFMWTATDADNDTAELMFDITVPAGICDRTTQVRAAILDEIDGVSDCGLVTVADLSSVTLLSLNNSGITALQADDFSGLSSVEILRLKDNSLSALPASVFSGLTSLNRLDLRGNPGSAFTLTLQLDRTDDADDAAQGPATVVVKVAEGAPFDMTIGLSVTGGTLSSSIVTIAKGSTQSGSVTVTQTGMVQATVSMGAAPALPANYRGIATAVGAPLVLFPVVNRAPEKVGTVAAQSLTEGAAAVTVDVSGNFSDPENDPLTYSATSDDEDAVTVSVLGSVVTISPVGAGSTTVTVTALDATGSNMSVDQTIAVTVLPAGLSFGIATIADQIYKQNAQITDLVLPKATGGTAPITYALSPETNGTPDLPAGLGFNANTRTISGIPLAAFLTTTFTWTATDAANATAELMFDITIPIGICSRTSQVQAAILDGIDGVNDCGLVTVADLSSVTLLSLNNSGITSLQAGDFSGLSSLEILRLKDNSLSALPAGVFSNLTSLTRVDLRGNPGSDFTLTLELDRTDDADDTASGPATIVVKVAEGAPFDMTVGLSVTDGTLSSSIVTIAKGSTQSGSITVTQTGMDQATVSLDAAPALPIGDNVSYRGITTAVGAPLVLFPVVNRAPGKVGTIAAQSLTEGAAAVTVDVSGNFSDPENDPLTYSATSDDEDVATVSVQGAVVTISPVGSGSATVTVTALDATGSNMSVDQTIAVTVTPAVLSFGSATIADQIYKQNAQITDLVLPTATGGTAPITYALSPETNGTPDLPAGLGFNANTRTISGIPLAAFLTTTFTWTATDAANATAELMFDITIPIGICSRTSQVQAAILDGIDGVSDCGLVTVADLSSVTTLSLNNSGITSLQSDDFSGLSSLETLRLKDNSLSALPASVFSGLTSLNRLDLRGNPGSAFTLTLQLDRTDDADDAAQGPATIVVEVAEGAPFDMTVGLSATGGTLSPSSVTIAKGSTQSGSITVTQTGMGQATVSMGAAPALPANYRGIATAVGNSLVLFPVVNRAPEKVGTIAAQSLTEGAAAVTVDVSGNFSDPENDPLTYSATSDDEDVVTVSVQGSVVTISPVGAGSATVTVTALDATGSNMSVDQTITVTVNPAGICSRTSQVRDEILDQINGVSDCGLVTVADLSSVTTLSLNNSGITTLQADDFSGLTSLANLRLKDNSLSTLPANVFSGLTSLNRLDLRGNPGSAFTLTLQLDRTDDTDDTAQGPATVVVKVAEGAPFDMTVGLSVTGGTLSSSSVTIAKGSTQSGPITVTQTGVVQATVSLGAAPALPNNYRGIQTAVGSPLVLF